MALPNTSYLALKKSDIDEYFPLADMNANMDTMELQLTRAGGKLAFSPTLLGAEWFSPSTGITVDTAGRNEITRKGKWVFLQLTLKRDASTPVGNITDVNLGTLSTPYRPFHVAPLTAGQNSANVTGYVSTGGTVMLTTNGGVSSIPAGTSFTLIGKFLGY